LTISTKNKNQKSISHKQQSIIKQHHLKLSTISQIWTINNQQSTIYSN